MTFAEVMNMLEEFGDPNTKKSLLKHGAQEPFFGVKVADLKKIQKKVKKDYDLSLALFESGNSDAMYLAALIADERKMTKENLQAWVKNAYWSYLSEYAVPWVASETPFGIELGSEWIESKEENIASAGWATFASIASITPDDEIDISLYATLLERAVNDIPTAPNRVKYVMNGFIIAIGSYITALNEKAMECAHNIGKVQVDMNGTACKVPLATTYIQKIIDKNKVGNKRKSARC